MPEKGMGALRRQVFHVIIACGGAMGFVGWM